MTQSAEVCYHSALANGVDEVCKNSPQSISPEFYKNNWQTLIQKRGCGYWLWKPYIIYNAMLSLKDGDYCVYSDAGVKWINNVNEIISRMDQDIFLFSNGHSHIHWCKMDVFQAVLHRPLQPAWHPLDIQYQQVQASVIFIKVNQNTRNFIKEWLLWCQFPGFIDDSPSNLPNHPEFAEHRHDQAVLTCLAIKYGYKLHWWPDAKWYLSQRYRWPEDTYPEMLEHHRNRDKGKGDGVNPEWE
jgi:hypothetical protein